MSDPNKINSLNRNRLTASTHDQYRGVPSGEYEDDRAEKPWQRVPSTLLIIVLGVYLLLGYLTQLVEDDMPAIVHEADLARDNADTFSEEAAKRFLDRMIGNAPRVAGTAYHLEMTADLKAMLDDIAAQANQVVKTDWQIASGDYFHESSTAFFNMYQNTSNIIALLEGESGFHENGTIGSSILVNCHYDSVPFALGASDNVAFCAIMAESLKKLSRRTEKLKRNIVFLFNGAEENGLQASHAFLQHPWAKGVTAVINLDAGGMNGKATIFQVTDPRVLNAYQRSAVKPNAQGLAEFLFSSGIIPSDTDFRIWRNFGDIHGVDIAFVKWANVYHTRNDRPELILPGVLQGGGDMLLALLKETANVDDLDEQTEPTAAVYYDFLNVFLVTYSFAASYAVDALIALFGLTSVSYYVWLVGTRWSTVQNLLFTVLGRLAAVLAGLVVVAVCVLLMVATTVQMRYLPLPWLVVPLYWVPYLLAAVAAAHVFDAWRLKTNGLNRSLRCLQAMAATRLILSLILLVLVCIPPFTSLRYLFSAPLFLMSITAFVSITIVKYVSLTGWQHLLLEVCLSIPSVMFMYSLALRVNAQMLPIMNRSSEDMPDLTVAMLNAGLAVIVSSTISGVELLFSRRRLWIVLSLLGTVCFVLMFIPFSPYDSDGIALQRHYWFHSEIVSYDMNNNTMSRTSGIVVTKLDPYSTQGVLPALAAEGHHVSARQDLAKDCENRVYCGLPLFRTGSSRYLSRAMFVYTDPPAPFAPPADLRVSTKVCTGEECRYRFVFTAAHHNMITFWPRANISISSWTLGSPPRVCHELLDRPVYVMYHSAATYNEPGVHFTIDVAFKVPIALQSQAIVDVSHHSHKIHHPEDFTSEYSSILNAMPPYFNIASFLSFRHDYVF